MRLAILSAAKDGRIVEVTGETHTSEHCSRWTPAGRPKRFHNVQYFFITSISWRVFRSLAAVT